MVQQVIKKDGRKEPFEARKIINSVKSAADEIPLTEQRKDQLAREMASSVVRTFEKKQEAETKEIREHILNKLRFAEPPVFDAWKRRQNSKESFKSY